MHIIERDWRCECRQDLPPAEHVLADAAFPCPVHSDAELPSRDDPCRVHGIRRCTICLPNDGYAADAMAFWAQFLVTS